MSINDVQENISMQFSVTNIPKVEFKNVCVYKNNV